jgi:hypothetical protein
MLSKDLLGLIVQHTVLDTTTDVSILLEALPTKFRETIFKRLFEIKFPYTLLSDLNLKCRVTYEIGYNFMVKCITDHPKVPKEFENNLFNRKKNRSLMIPINLNPSDSVFEHFKKEFNIDGDKYTIMKSLLTGSHERFSKMLLEHNLIQLIPRPGDCIIDYNDSELGYRDAGKYWCSYRDDHNFIIIPSDIVMFSDYGSLPRDFTFPYYSPEYFKDVLSYYKVIGIDNTHPEIQEQFKKQKDNKTIIFKTTNPPNYLVAENYFIGYTSVSWIGCGSGYSSVFNLF